MALYILKNAQLAIDEETRIPHVVLVGDTVTDLGELTTDGDVVLTYLLN